MKLLKPLKRFNVSQRFGINGTPLYNKQGLLGHPAMDAVDYHESPIYASHDGWVSAVGNKNNIDLMKYRAVYTIIESDGVTYELSYGHCLDIYVEEGQEVKAGEVIATQGNTGNCYTNGVLVTREMKQAGSGAGSHLHYQLRLVKKVDKIEKGKKYLTNSKGKVKKDGYYEIVDYANGYAGCVDPEPFLVGEPKEKTLLTQTLRYGSRGDQVKMLQQLLGLPVQDGIFGFKTEIAVKLFQKSKGLTQDGICGAKTRQALINS